MELIYFVVAIGSVEDVMALVSVDLERRFWVTWKNLWVFLHDDKVCLANADDII